MANIIVLGGGITGLSCAYYLSKFGKDAIKKVILIEKSTTLGGWLQSSRFPDGTVYEHGPKSMRVFGQSGFNSLSLIDELGLANDILPIKMTDSAARKRLILINNNLVSIPSGVKDLFKTIPPLKHSFAYYGIKELFGKKQLVEDESVHSFVTRRFGSELADYIFDPVVRGIVAGDSKQISVRSLLGGIFKAEQEYGSIIKGQFKKGADIPLGTYLKSNLATTAKKDRWAMWSLKNGLQTLPERLSAVLEEDPKVQILTNVPCDRIHFEGRKALVHFEGDATQTSIDHVFSCIPAKRLSGIVSSHHPTIGKHLSFIPSVHVAVVNLEFKGKILKEEGFGFLIPSNQNSKLLGITFDSCCFPAHDGKYADKTRSTVMMGGHWFKELFGSIDTVSPDKLLEVALEGIRNILNISQEPTRYQVNIMRNCIPQYKVGHHSILTNIKNEISKEEMCLTLLGCSYEGVSVNDCIYFAKVAAENYVKNLNS